MVNESVALGRNCSFTHAAARGGSSVKYFEPMICA